MAQSLNSKVDFTIPASSFLWTGSKGKVMLGDKAFEFYNDKNVEDYIQIPWDEIESVSCSVWFNKYITRFVIFTKKDGHYAFSARNNKQTLKVVQSYIGKEKLNRSLSFLQTIGRGIKVLFHIK